MLQGDAVQHRNFLRAVALLVGCGCEMLAACRDPKIRLGERVFVELLPDGDWQVLAKHLYTALRDGLAHGFDTKHIVVDGKEHQISFHWDETQVIRILPIGVELGIRIGPCVLAEALCAKITDFETMLRTDEPARQRFIAARQRPAELGREEREAWRRLVGD
jgi:hypothetical protein